jgi:spore coat protein CotH
VYAPEVLQSFDLRFAPGEWDALLADCVAGAKAYHPARLFDGTVEVEAQVRPKGNWSFSCDKLQFVVAFDQEHPKARYHGLQKLVFDAPWYDHSLMHERLAFSVFADLGLPGSCVNHAEVSVNGAPYGVYANVERLDQEYLARNFEASDGFLYQGGERENRFDEDDGGRFAALQAAQTLDEIEALVDVDASIAEWAVEAMLPALDNYWAGVDINFAWYDHPERGFQTLPMDLDIAFGDAAYPGGGPFTTEAATLDPITYEHGGWLKEPIFLTVLADPDRCAQFVAALGRARAAYDPDTLIARVDAWDAQIAMSLARDARRPWTDAEHAAAIADLHTFLPARAAFVDDWLAAGGHCPSR